jgi:hypothetical protein
LGTQTPSSEGVFALSVCIKLWPVDSDGGSRPWPGWPPRWPIPVCGWQAQCSGWWAHRLLFMGAGGSSFRFCRLVWDGQHPFMALRCGNDMTKPLGCGTVSEGRFWLHGGVVVVYLSGQRRCGQSPQLRPSWSGRRGRAHCQVQGYEFISAVSEKKQTEPSRTPFTPPPDVRLGSAATSQ